jgi:hypothetical protein
MTRSAASRSSAVRTEKVAPSISSGVRSSEAREPSLPVSNVPWYWRLALFLWTTSFVFLLIYEWLAGILKMVRGHSAP